MLYKCQDLIEVLEQSIFTIDRHIESFRKYNCMLEDGIRNGNFYKEEQILRLQGQSLLSTLLVLRDTNYQKINLIKRKLHEK